MSSVYGDHQNMAAPPTIQQQRLKVFRDKAWCRDWPSDKKTLLRSEVESASSSRSSGAKDVGDDEITYAEWRAGYTVVSDRLDYTYLWDIDEVARAIQAPPPLYSNIVVLKEYEALLQSLTVGKLKGERQCVVVTGHPGIGKSTFLIYLLLRRLAGGQPTAIQFEPSSYIVFDHEGVAVIQLDDPTDRLESCWLLVDSNSGVVQPHARLASAALRVIQATPPQTGRWKSWAKDYRARLFVMDLPDIMEVAAIAKEHGQDPSSAARLVVTWGPCPRTILDIVEGFYDADSTQASAELAAEDICDNPALLKSFFISSKVEPSAGSSIFFVIPPREYQPDGSVRLVRDSGAPMIPTRPLVDLFLRKLHQLHSTKSTELHRTLGSPPSAGSSTSWRHEAITHASLSAGGNPVRLFRGTSEMWLQPTTRKIHGTLDTLAAECKSPTTSFYWRPSAVNMSGIDTLLMDISNSTSGGEHQVTNVYAIQIATALQHRSPAEGLRKLWGSIRQRVHPEVGLHVVVAADKVEVAQRLVTQYQQELEDFKLGGLRVHVWGCVLP